MKNLELKKICEVCGREFIGEASKRACSKKCYMKIWRQENLEHRNDYKREHYHTQDLVLKSKQDKKSSLWMYRMSVEQFDKLLSEQEGHCALCDSTCNNNGYRLHVDHDHNCCDTRGRQRTCGKCNRGLLCGICNRYLGFLEKFLPNFESVKPKEGTWEYKSLAYIEKYKVKI